MLDTYVRTVLRPDKKPSIYEHRLRIFTLQCYGRHPTYLQHLINHWCRHEPTGNLDIVVLPSFLHEHADVVDMAQQSDSIHFVSTTPEEQSVLKLATSSVDWVVQNMAGNLADCRGNASRAT